MAEEFDVGDWVVYEDPETGETKNGIVTSIRDGRGTIVPITRIDEGSPPQPTHDKRQTTFVSIETLRKQLQLSA